MVDQDLLAPATLILVVCAPIDLEVEVLEQDIAAMLRPASLKIVGPPDTDDFAGDRITQDVRTTACWQGSILTGTS